LCKDVTLLETIPKSIKIKLQVKMQYMLLSVLNACHLIQTCARIRIEHANFKQLYFHTLILRHIFTYIKLFTRNNPQYHLLKYLPFFLKHPVYIHTPIIYYIEMFCLRVQTILNSVISSNILQGVVNI
jgi:hypothetical protein